MFVDWQVKVFLTLKMDLGPLTLVSLSKYGQILQLILLQGCVPGREDIIWTFWKMTFLTFDLNFDPHVPIDFWKQHVFKVVWPNEQVGMVRDQMWGGGRVSRLTGLRLIV